jgi:hypothetical protein
MRERIASLSLRLAPPVSVGLVLGLIGPFGTYDLLPMNERLIYWLTVVSANWLLADAVIRRVDVVAGDRLPLPRILVPLSGAGLAAVPATGVVTLANGMSGIGWPENVTMLFGQVLLLLTTIALPVYTWEDMRERIEVRPGPVARGEMLCEKLSPAGSPQTWNNCPSHFTARLSGPLAGRLICLEMQDHYLVVHHSGGTDMILCRMEDAARELRGLGRRVHRSWWVAADAVDGVERQGQRTLLRLTDNRRVPVGRSFRRDLKSSGWL